MNPKKDPFDQSELIEAINTLTNMLSEHHEAIANDAAVEVDKALAALGRMSRSINMRKTALRDSQKVDPQPRERKQNQQKTDAQKQRDDAASDVKPDPSGQPNREPGLTQDDEYPKQKAKPSTPCAECAKAAATVSELKPDLNGSDTKLPDKKPKLAGRRAIAAIFISVVTLALGTALLAAALSSDLRKAVFSAAVFQTASANSRHSGEIATAIILGHSGQVTSLVCDPVKPTTSDVTSQLE